MDDNNQLLRALPQVDEVIRMLAGETGQVPESTVKRAVQEQIGRWREDILAGTVTAVPLEMVLAGIRCQIAEDAGFHLRGVINATGVILHTNLGRARLSQQAAEHLAQLSSSYSNVEYQLDSGQRGVRYDHVETLLTQLTGTEAALVVNNNAAAVLLALDTLAKGREVIVSRGELVEIGGSFRIPAILERSGCHMVEVGATNKTHLADYADHITPQTGALLKVHTSNYRVIGFTEEVPLPQLWQLGGEHNVPVICDLGSGLLTDLAAFGIHGEPTVGQCAPYADVLCFSGDKLLGGPQAGIIVGRKAAIEPMKRNHLLRALRIDKLTLAALEYTLRQYLSPETATQTIPTLHMLTLSPQALADKATMLTSLLRDRPGITWERMDITSQVGGGALPQVNLPSLGLGIESTTLSPNQLELRLRQNSPPIVARIVRDRVVLDLRTIDYSEMPAVAACLNQL